MMKRIDKIIARIREVQRTLSMDHANFEVIGEPDVIIKAGNVTGFIRERTRLWMRTWVLGFLDDVVRELEGKPYRHPALQPYAYTYVHIDGRREWRLASSRKEPEHGWTEIPLFV